MTQPKFNVGDTVRYVIQGSFGLITLGSTYTVLSVREWDGAIDVNNAHAKYYYPAKHFALEKDTLEAARDKLEAAGYKVTPPKEKGKGKVYIHKSGDYTWACLKDTVHEKNPEGTIAIVDWEEGQGLNNGS